MKKIVGFFKFEDIDSNFRNFENLFFENQIFEKKFRNFENTKKIFETISKFRKPTLMGTEILFTKLKVHMIEYILHGVCHIVCPTVHKRLNIRSRFSQSRCSQNRGQTVIIIKI